VVDSDQDQTQIREVWTTIQAVDEKRRRKAELKESGFVLFNRDEGFIGEERRISGWRSHPPTAAI
jgi:hypothetical protein